VGFQRRRVAAFVLRLRPPEREDVRLALFLAVFLVAGLARLVPRFADFFAVRRFAVPATRAARCVLDDLRLFAAVLREPARFRRRPEGIRLPSGASLPPPPPIGASSAGAAIIVGWALSSAAAAIVCSA
jgi:hypothetical protein